ncbi:MAG: AAA family ATPase [Polyangiaceae bacterium]
MKLSRFEVERFGHFSKRTFDLGDTREPAVFLGPNEAGKSTLLAFLRELLFGFHEKSRYAFSGADEVAGNVTATLEHGDTIAFRRRKGRKNTVTGTIGESRRVFAESELAGFVGQANASLFANVFAFGLEELERGQESLKSAQLESAIYAGALGGGRDVKAIAQSLDMQIAQLFKPRGQNQPIAETAARMKELADAIADASLKSRDFSAAVDRAIDRNARVAVLEKDIAALRAELARVERLLVGAPLLDRKRAFAKELAEIASPIDRRLVEHGAEVRTLSLAAPEMAELRVKVENAAAKNEGEREELEAAARNLDSAWDAKRILSEAPNAVALGKLQELSRSRARLEAREEAAALAATEADRRRELAGATANANAGTPTREIVEEKRQKRDRGIALLARPDDLWVNRERKEWLAGDKTPFPDAVKKAVADADLAVDALFAQGDSAAAQAAAHANWKRTSEDAERATVKLVEAREAIAVFDREWTTRASPFGSMTPPDACRLAQQIAELAGRMRLSNERNVQIANARARIASHVERVERLRAALLTDPIPEDTSAISVLLARVERADRAALLESDLARIDRQIADLEPNPERLASLVEELSNANLLELDALRARLRRDLTTSEKLHADTLREAGVADANKASLDGSAKAARLAAELESKRAELGALVDRFGPLVVARHALGESIARFERDNQPGLLSSVSRLLARITGERWVRVEQRFAETRLRVVSAQGEERTFDELSTGTREQLYLAIRLAFVEDYCKKNEPLPIVMDDVFVNFDEARAKGAFSALKPLLERTQIFFFTCHERQVEIARAVFPNLNLIRI